MDPEQERIRLAELYSTLTDEELQELADDWESLTDTAHQALKDEMTRHRMRLTTEALAPPEDNAGPLDPETMSKFPAGLLDPVTAAEFPNLEEALLAKGLLESGGIQCALGSNGNQFLDPDGYIGHKLGFMAYNGTGYNPYIGRGVDLLVNKADVAAALEVLNQSTFVEPEPEG